MTIRLDQLPNIPSFTRYKNVFWSHKYLSIFRSLQYETLAQTHLRGKVLDFGGGKRAKYHHIIHCDSYESANIDPAMEPTWLTQPGAPLPCPEAHYDTVFSLNTFEHIFDVHQVLGGLYKTLKPGGDLVFSVPFLYPVHAHPDDFFRGTPSWWQGTLSRLGFKDIEIRPLIWGPFSTGLLCSGIPGPFKKLRTHAALLADLLYARLRFRGKSDISQDLKNYALGYFIKAVK